MHRRSNLTLAALYAATVAGGIPPAPRAPRLVLSPDPMAGPVRVRFEDEDGTAESIPVRVRVRTPPSAARKRNRKRKGWR